MIDQGHMKCRQLAFFGVLEIHLARYMIHVAIIFFDLFFRADFFYARCHCRYCCKQNNFLYLIINNLRRSEHNGKKWWFSWTKCRKVRSFEDKIVTRASEQIVILVQCIWLYSLCTRVMRTIFSAGLRMNWMYAWNLWVFLIWFHPHSKGCSKMLAVCFTISQCHVRKFRILFTYIHRKPLWSHQLCYLL